MNLDCDPEIIKLTFENLRKEIKDLKKENRTIKETLIKEVEELKLENKMLKEYLNKK
tara:strand:+ start:2146 stop:2316 length:171 start_codon:yes stop_codon:yes gene_type:complete